MITQAISTDFKSQKVKPNLRSNQERARPDIQARKRPAILGASGQIRKETQFPWDFLTNQLEEKVHFKFTCNTLFKIIFVVSLCSFWTYFFYKSIKLSNLLE